MYAWIISTAQQARPNVIGQRLPVRAQFTSLSMLATTKPLPAISPVMPLTTASCAGPWGRCSRFQASAVVSGAFMRLLPIQRALVPLIDEANREDRKEAKHGEKTQQADARQADRPGEEERDFDVENNEENGYEIEAHIESPPRIAKRLESAFIGREFGGIRLLMGREYRAENHRQTDESRDRGEDDDWEIVRKDRLHSTPPRG